MPSDKNKTQTELVPINIREGLQKIRPSLNLLTVAGLILILAFIVLGIIFGLKNNQGIDRLVSQDLSQALDQSRQSMNEKERYIEQLVNQIRELEQELVRVRAQNPELIQLEEQTQLISKLEEQISRLQDENLKKSLEYSKALDEQNDEIARLQEELSESYDIIQEQSDAMLQSDAVFQALDQALEENSALQSTIDEKNTEIARLEKELSESYGIGEQEGDAVVQALEENSALQSTIDEQNDEIARLNKLLDQACDCEKVENVITKAKYIKKVEPVYELGPRETGKRGECVSTFTISETGKANNIEIECTDPFFNNLVLVALNKSIFQPESINGIVQADLRYKAPFSFMPPP